MEARKSQTIRLACMMVLTFGYFLVEIIVGYMTGSLALVSDSYHMLSDFLALIVGLACVRISQWDSQKNTYGWVRAEVLGALINSVFLIALCFTIFTEGITRLISPPKIENVNLLLWVGIAGFGINIFGLLLFCTDTRGGHHGHSHGGGGGGHGHSHGGGSSGHGHSSGSGGHGHSNGSGGHGHSHGSGGHGHSHEKKDKVERPLYTVDSVTSDGGQLEDSAGAGSQYEAGETGSDLDALSVSREDGVVKSGSQLNMIGVFLHILGDALGSVVVIISGIVIKFVDAEWVYRLDPALSIIMVIIILSTTIPLLKESAFILLQTVPTHIKVSELRDKLLNKVSGIISLHEFHVWQLAGNRIIASGHIRCDSLGDYKKIATRVKSFFHNEGIHSTTFQPEFNENFLDYNSENDSLARDCFFECGPDKTCFINTCCSNKEKRRLSDSTNSTIAVTDCNGTAEPPAQVNVSFDVVDETVTVKSESNVTHI